MLKQEVVKSTVVIERLSKSAGLQLWRHFGVTLEGSSGKQSIEGGAKTSNAGTAESRWPEQRAHRQRILQEALRHSRTTQRPIRVVAARSFLVVTATLAGTLGEVVTGWWSTLTLEHKKISGNKFEVSSAAGHRFRSLSGRIKNLSTKCLWSFKGIKGVARSRQTAQYELGVVIQRIREQML